MTGGIGKVNHTCLLFRDHSAQKKVLLPFITEGLSNGENCLLVCDEDVVDDWRLEFQAFGIDVAKQIKRGSLVIATGQEWREMPMNSIKMAKELWSYIEDKLGAFPRVRIAGDASWALLPAPIGSDRLCHWEATADLLYQDAPVRTICMYDLNRHPPSDIRAALRTHRHVILDETTYDNPHYEAARILENEPDWNNSDADEALIERLLSTLGPAVN
jgi:hypothetical protein